MLIVLFTYLLVAINAQIPVGSSTHTLSWGGRTRTFIIDRPSNTGATTPAALVFVFHGYTNTASWMRTAAAVSATATSQGFIGVTPSGYSNSWNAGSCCGQAQSLRIDDVGFAKAMVDYISSRAMIDSDKVFTTGYSNGGMLSYRIICEAGDVFKAGGGFAGTFYTSYTCNPSVPRPYAHMHGTTDSVVNYYTSNTAYTRYVTNVQGCPSTYKTIYTNPSYYNMECFERNPCKGSTPFGSVFCMYTGMGHVIPTSGLLRNWNYWTTGRMSLGGPNETATDMLQNSTAAWARLD